MEKTGEATFKAKDLVRMGVAKVTLLNPLEDFSTEVTPSALVLGGGVAGLSAALALGNQGYVVELVEKEEHLGGLLRFVNRVFPSHQSASELLDPLINTVLKHQNIRVHLGAELTEVKGFVGNFKALIRQNGESRDLKVGTIIVAVGALAHKPKAAFGYDRFENVMTQLDFEGQCGQYDGFNHVVMISCVGARNEERSYCGRFCCIVGLKNALLIKEANPRADVTILHRDVMAVGKLYEDYYRRALEKGVRFVRYETTALPRVEGTGTRAEKVKVFHTLMGKEITLNADLVLLTTPLVPGEDNGALSRMMKIPLGMDGFFLEAHQKLRPVEFPADGIFVAGCARYPAEITESISQALAAAAKAAVPLAQGKVVSEAFVAEVDPSWCSACGRCVNICPFGAVDWAEARTPDGATRKVASVNPAECKGCGLCSSSCLSGAIRISGFTDQQILAMIANQS
jgi:heterodisulfide reductase subunit A